MKKYNDGYDDGYNDGNKYRKTTTMPLSDHYPMVRSSIQSQRLGLTEEHQSMVAMVLWKKRNMYLRLGIYICPIETMVTMCHKLLYLKIGVLGLCC